MSDLEDYDCPLCMEELDISERNFKPCPCGYQICRFCWHHIKEELNGKCPACRRTYSDENVQFTPITPAELARIKTERKFKEREKKEIESMNRKHLANVRVVQKNLIYVIGLTARVTEEVLRSSDYFGQYGKITKVVINRRHAQNSTSTHPGQTPTVGVYITFARREDAAKAIAAVDGSMSDGRILRVTYGTTKYCTYYLRNMPCQNPNCMYLHEPGEEADTFTREDLASGKHNLKDHHAQLEHSSPKPQTLGIHSTSSTLATINQEKLSPDTAETPTAIYKSESKSSERDSEGSALPATASWAKITSNKSKPSTTKSPVLNLDQFPPPPAATRPKAKVISLSRKPDAKSRTNSEEDDKDRTKSSVAETASTGNATLTFSCSPKEDSCRSDTNEQVTEQTEAFSKVTNSHSVDPEMLSREESFGNQAHQQHVSDSPLTSECGSADEERLHQEVMAKLEKERSAFYQQQSRSRVTFLPGLLEAFSLNPAPSFTNVYKGGFDPFGSDSPTNEDSSNSLITSMQTMQVQDQSANQSSSNVNNTLSVGLEQLPQPSQSQKQNYQDNSIQSVNNSRPKLYSRFGFALSEEDEVEPPHHIASPVSTRTLHPSSLFDPFKHTANRGLYPVSMQSKQEKPPRVPPYRAGNLDLPMASKELGHLDNSRYLSSFTPQSSMSFSARFPEKSVPPGMSPPPGYTSGYDVRMGNSMNEHRFGVNFSSHPEKITDYERSLSNFSCRNPSQSLWDESQIRTHMDMFDRNLHRFPDSQLPSLELFDPQFTPKQPDFLSTLLKTTFEKRNTTLSTQENGTPRDSRHPFEDSDFGPARVSSPHSVDFSEKTTSPNWKSNVNVGFQSSSLHRLRGYDMISS